MKRWPIVIVVASAGASLAAACSDDPQAAPMVFPQQGDASTSSSSGGASSSSSSSSSGSPGGDAGTNAYCIAADALYATAEGCCAAADKTTEEYKYLDFARSFTKLACTLIDDGIAMGRLTVNDAALKACNAAIDAYRSSASCPYGPAYRPFFGLVDEDCRKAFTGTVASGGACRGDWECADGLTCIDYAPSQDGTCSTPPDLGMHCGAARNEAGSSVEIDLHFGNHPGCAPGAFCAYGECTAQKADGEACSAPDQCENGAPCYQAKCGGTGPSADGGPCVFTEDCTTGLACDYPTDGGAGGTCGAPQAAGAPCIGAPAECAGRCEKPDGGGTGKCVTWCGSK